MPLDGVSTMLLDRVQHGPHRRLAPRGNHPVDSCAAPVVVICQIHLLSRALPVHTPVRYAVCPWTATVTQR